MEDALGKLTRQPVMLTGAGRTDTGVHARCMYAHLDLEQIPDTTQLCYRLNAFLPEDIAVKRIFPVDPEAHARFDAISRRYEYHITREKDPFQSAFAYYFHAPLDVDAMNAAANILLEYRDFKCFSRSNTDVKTYLCSLTEARWVTEGSKLVFHIEADRFLRNMVRAVVGTLLEIGTGKWTVAQLREILESRDRSAAGPSAPAHGLYLVDVRYPSTLYQHTI